jgi:hypothetical protein
MRAALPYSDDLVTIIRWVARIIALFLAIVIVIFVSGTGVNLAHLQAGELARAASFFLAWLGLILAWRWDGIGGALIIAGILLFYVLDYFVTGSVLRFWLFLIFFLPGVMLLYCWWQTRHGQRE